MRFRLVVVAVAVAVAVVVHCYIPGKEGPSPDTPQGARVIIQKPENDFKHVHGESLSIEILVLEAQCGVHGIEFGQHGVALFLDGLYVQSLYFPPLVVEWQPHLLSLGMHTLGVGLVNQRHQLNDQHQDLVTFETVEGKFGLDPLPFVTFEYPFMWLPIYEGSIPFRFRVDNIGNRVLRYTLSVQVDGVVLWETEEPQELSQKQMTQLVESIYINDDDGGGGGGDQDKAIRKICVSSVQLLENHNVIASTQIQFEILSKELESGAVPLYMLSHSYHQVKQDHGQHTETFEKTPCYKPEVLNKCNGKKFIYLMQSPEEKDMSWYRGPESDAIVMTFKSPPTSLSSLYYPNSTWNQGRNALFRAALSNGCDYEYFIFMDDDVSVSTNIPGEMHPLRAFESCLSHNLPAIGVGNQPMHAQADWYDWMHYASKEDNFTNTLYWWDHYFVAIHRTAAKLLLPYYEGFDSISTYYSQNMMIHLGALFFPGSVLQCNRVFTSNSDHRWLYTHNGRTKMVNEHIMHKPEEFLLPSILNNEFKFGFRSHHGYTHYNGPVQRNVDESALKQKVEEAFANLDLHHPLWSYNREFWSNYHQPSSSSSINSNNSSSSSFTRKQQELITICKKI